MILILLALNLVLSHLLIWRIYPYEASAFCMFKIAFQSLLHQAFLRTSIEHLYQTPRIILHLRTESQLEFFGHHRHRMD